MNYWLLLIKLNGLYDILCCLCILLDIIPEIQYFHLQLFNNISEYNKNILTSFILIWGFMRILSNDKIILIISYIIEILYLLYIFYYLDTNHSKILITISLSILFIFIILLKIR